MTIAAVTGAHTIWGGNSSSGIASSGINTSTSTLLAVSVSSIGTGSGGTPASVKDSKNNFWFRANVIQNTSGTRLQTVVFFCLNPTVGTGHTFTVTGSFFRACVQGYNGIPGGTWYFDGQAKTAASSGTSISPGSVTPTATPALFITAFAPPDGSTTTTIAVNSSFTITDAAGFGGGFEGGGMAYKVSTSAENPTWSGFSSGNCVAWQGVFRQLSAPAVAQTAWQAAANAASVAVDTTGAGALIVPIGLGTTGSLTSVTDSFSNTYTLGTVASGTSIKALIAYCLNPTVGASHTVTINNTGSIFFSASLLAFSGRYTFDQYSHNTATATSIQPGSLTLPANDLVVACCAPIDTNPPTDEVTVDSGFLLGAGAQFFNSVAQPIYPAWLSPSAAAAYNPTFSYQTSGNVAAAMLALKSGSPRSFGTIMG